MWDPQHQSPFGLVYQPIVDLESNSTEGYEALARFTGRREMQTQAVILAFEKRQCIDILDRSVARYLIGQMEDPSFAKGKPLHLNVSGQSFSSPDFTQWFTDVVQSMNNPSRLTVELTETAEITNRTVAENFATRISELGVSLSLDDFGAGYATRDLLQLLPFNNLKIDGSYTRRWSEREDAIRFADHAVTLAKKLGMTTTIEFIESPDDLIIAKSLGINFGQGYLFSRPLDARHLKSTNINNLP